LARYFAFKRYLNFKKERKLTPVLIPPHQKAIGQAEPGVGGGVLLVGVAS